MFVINSFRKVLLALTISFFSTAGVALADDCEMQISQPVLDYGALNPDILRAGAKASATAALDKRRVQLNVLCPDSRSMAIAFRGAASGAEAYQLGDRGTFELVIKAARLDGVPVLVGTVSNIGEVPATASNSVNLVPGQYIVPVLAQKSSLGKVFSMDIEVNSHLFTERLKVRDLVVLEGKGYFDLQ